MAKQPFALEFERPLIALESKIAELKDLSGGAKVDFGDEITKLERKAKRLQAEIFSDLTPWQIVQLARHPTFSRSRATVASPRTAPSSPASPASTASRSW